MRGTSGSHKIPPILRMCVWLILVITLHITEAYLPGTARRVDSCPEPNNLTAWKIAARELNCSEYIEDNIRKGNLYHCLPSNFLNETIEFCGGFAAIDKGHCPVFNYQNGATIATGRSCENFTSGCPEPLNPPYHSLHFYEYPECWKIHRIARCYHAEPNCSKDEHSYGTSNNTKITGWLVPVIVVAVVVVVFIVAVIVILLIRRGKTKNNNDADDTVVQYREAARPGIPTPEANPLLKSISSKENDDNSNLECEYDVDGRKVQAITPINEIKEKSDGVNEKTGDKETKKDNSDTVTEPVVCYTSEVTKSRNVDDKRSVKGQDQEKDLQKEVLKYNAFYYRLCAKILQRDLLPDLKMLLQDPTDKNVPVCPKDLLSYWNKKHNFFYNTWHLQELLKQCGADDLFSECETFAQDHLMSMTLRYFLRKSTDKDREILEVHTSHNTKKPAVIKEMEEIRETIANNLGYEKYEILLTGMKEGSLIFIFSVPGGNIRNLTGDRDMSSFWKIGIFKIETPYCVITPENGLQMKNSGTFAQPRGPTKRQNNCSTAKKRNNEKTRRLMQNNEGIGSWISESNLQKKMIFHLVIKDEHTPLILKRNLKMFVQLIAQEINCGSHGRVFEKQATMTIRQRTSQPKTWIYEKYSELQHKKILEEMEPNAVLGILKPQYPMLYEDFERATRSGNCRKEKAENLLNHLKEGKGKQFKDLQNGIIETSNLQKRNTDDDLRIENVKRKISSKWKDLVDEIDSTIINDTMERLDLSREKCTKLFNASSGKPRRDRVTAFLEFVLENEDYLLPFDGILLKHELCDQ